jgi:hypothetical protein
MPAQADTSILGKPIEKVGVIMVHGVGEQRRFEHLESETRKIVDAIIANYGQRRRDVTVTLSVGTGDAYQASQSSWVSGAEAPLHALVHLKHKIVDIAFHEVWWADINETLTLGKQVRFWLWGLSLPGIATRNQQVLPGALERTRRPDHADELTWWHRIRMGYVSILFGLSAFSIALVNMVLKRLQFSPVFSTGVIVNYLSGVKLYSQDQRAGGSPMDGPDEPPRAAIRRRMVRTMLDVATTKYDRWYILAHSLGTVVAWNGLMEIERTLPNYLDRTRWDEDCIKPLERTSPTAFNVNAMMPNRPIWLGRREIIDRDALFAKFGGILTYGSPLERFCALWSNMVPINRTEDPFPAGAEWINVYDPTDPVGSWISDFDPKQNPRTGHATLKPNNFPCRSSPILLFSHICYFNASRLRSLRLVNDSEHLLVNQVAHWLVEGGSLAARLEAAPKGFGTFWMPLAAKGTKAAWPVHARAVWRIVQWLVVGIALTLLTLFSLEYLIGPLLKWFHVPLPASALPWPTFGALLWGLTAIVVIVASAVHYAISSSERKDFDRRVKTQELQQEPEDLPEFTQRA